MNYNPPITSPTNPHHPTISYSHRPIHCPPHRIFYLSIYHQLSFSLHPKCHLPPSTVISSRRWMERLLCATHYARCSGQRIACRESSEHSPTIALRPPPSAHYVCIIPHPLVTIHSTSTFIHYPLTIHLPHTTHHAPSIHLSTVSTTCLS